MPVFFRLKRPPPNAALFQGLLCGILTLFAVGIAASAPGQSSGGYVDEYLQWFRKYVESRESNPIHALAMIDSACAVAERSADDSLVMVSRVNRGSFLVRQSRFDAGESDLQMALVYAERRRDSVQIGAVYNSMGIARQIRDDHAGALEYLLRSIDYLKDPTALARGYNNIGQVFDKLRDNDKAAEYLQRAVECTDCRQSALASGSMGNLGVVRYNQQRYGKPWICCRPVPLSPASRETSSPTPYVSRTWAMYTKRWPCPIRQKTVSAGAENQRGHRRFAGYPEHQQ
jgi:tetratricopeptide (TPR) repeat protein